MTSQDIISLWQILSDGASSVDELIGCIKPFLCDHIIGYFPSLETFSIGLLQDRSLQNSDHLLELSCSVLDTTAFDKETRLYIEMLDVKRKHLSNLRIFEFSGPTFTKQGNVLFVGSEVYQTRQKMIMIETRYDVLQSQS